MKKKTLCAVLAAMMAMGTFTTTTVMAEEKQDLVLNIDVADESFTTAVLDLVKEKFGDKYNLIIKTWAGIDEIQNIKTAALAGEQIDLCMYWPGQMEVFLGEQNLAMPLDEYMTEEWKARFSEGALELGTYDGVLYNLAYSTVYPMVIVNKDIADAAGVTLNEDGNWTWDEFIAFCETVETNTEAFGTAIPSGFTPWLTRNGYMQIWETEEELNAFVAGETSFHEEEITAVNEMIKNAFEEDNFYPGGEASWALELDEVYAAMASGKAASMFTVNSMALAALENAGIENYVIMDWPTMGPNPVEPLLGGSNGYFIPATAKNVEGAVEVLDFLTSEEVATVRAEAGCVSTVKIADDANVDADLMSKISRCSDSIHGEITSISTELGVYLESMPANYFYYGEDAVQEMEDLRLEAVEE